MNIFDAAKSFPVELRAVLDDITNTLDSRASAERAAVVNRDALAASEIHIAELEATLEELDAAAVKAEARAAADEIPKGDVTKAVKASDRAAAELADARRAHERRTRAVEHLNAEAQTIDATIPDLKVRLRAAMTSYDKQILAALNEDLIAACPPLVPIIAAITAIDAQMPNGGFARDWLDCAKLISPVGYRSDHLSGHVRLSGTDLLATDEPLPTLPVGVATAIQEIVTVAKALRQHRVYQPPKVPSVEQSKRTEVEQRRFDARVRENEERQRRYDEELEQREARGREPYQARSLVREPGSPAARSVANSGSVDRGFSHDGSGTLSDEWRRIGALGPNEGGV
ncbi:hypothetical protein GCM10027093_11220 [Paraburkholderia jirisanensis]